jgi:hypothetical protein
MNKKIMEIKIMEDNEVNNGLVNEKKNEEENALAQVTYLHQQEGWITEKFVKTFYEKIDGEGTKLILDFVLIFARFEYALKKSGYIYKDSKDVIHVDWMKFIVDISPKFNDKTQEIKATVNYIRANPPKGQNLDANNNLVWQERDLGNHSETDKLRLLICGVRNNLFHGGKLNGTYQEWVFRNYKLLNSVIVILEEWLKLNEEVNINFCDLEF